MHNFGPAFPGSVVSSNFLFTANRQTIAIRMGNKLIVLNPNQMDEIRQRFASRDVLGLFQTKHKTFILYRMQDNEVSGQVQIVYFRENKDGMQQKLQPLLLPDMSAKQLSDFGLSSSVVDVTESGEAFIFYLKFKTVSYGTFRKLCMILNYNLI